MPETKPKVRMEVKELKKQPHKNIFEALSAFQGELKPLPKTGKVQFETNNGKKVDFTYTPLGEIMTFIYPLLAKHGLSVRHEISKEGIEAILTHESYSETYTIKDMVGEGPAMPGTVGEASNPIRVISKNGELRSGALKVTGGNDMKDVGGGITYAKRYTLTMLLGISSEDDKDVELMEQSAKNAIQTVYTRFKSGLEKATTAADVEKSMTVLKKDMATIEKGKAGALGLSKEQLEELIKAGDARIDDINANQDPEGAK